MSATDSVTGIKLEKEVNDMGAIAALIIVAAFGTGLLIYFHFEDKKNARMNMGE